MTVGGRGGGGKDQLGAGRSAACWPARDVVVVHVGLEDEAEVEVALRGGVEEAPDVALRVDEDGLALVLTR